MTLKWSISHDDKLVTAQVTGLLLADDVQGIYAAMVAQGGLPYRKLVDLRFAPLELGGLAITRLSSIAISATDNARLGPVAFMINSDVAAEMIDHFYRRTRRDRPLRVFRDPASAMQWLDEIAPVRPA